MPDDPTYQDGMYWVTGPEGEANNGKGTQFYSNAGSDWQSGNYGEGVYGYVNWDTYKDGNKIRSQPDNSAPFLTVGFGTTGKWDDAAMGGDTTVGFIKETNLANSSLNIKAGGGTVSLEGDIGKGKGLDTVNIESTGAVTIGNEKNTATNYKYGTIYADHGVYISGGTVSVGGEIHSGTTDKTASASDITTRSDGYQNTAFQLDSVTIKSAGDLTVHGVESDGYTDSDGNLKGGKISLTSTGNKGKITLGAGVDYNGNDTDGTLAAASTTEGAVVVDAQGSQGSLVNSTTGKNAITTGENGTWQVYVNSPSDYGTSLGSNLNSGTNAQWTAKSGSNTTVKTNSFGNTLTDYPDTSSNKFVFQVTPVITISGGSQQKTYGDTLTKDQLRDLLSTSATYTDSTGKDVDVTQFGNFKEADYLTYVTSSDGTKTGTNAVAVSSDGAEPGATRTNGDEDKKASDGNKAFYVFNVEKNGAKALNGYDLKTVNGDIEILRKTLTINTSGTQTYGNATVTSGTPEADSTQLMNGDTLDTGSIFYKIATDGKYADSKGSNDTAHVGSYENQYLTTSAKVKASDGSDASVNYEVTGSGTITVKPADLYLTVGNVSTTYGTPFKSDDYTYTIDTTQSKGLVNGDTQDSALGDNFLKYTNTGDATDPDKIAKGATTQNAGGKYELQGAVTKNLTDYTVHIANGTSTVEKANLVVDTTGNTRTYGDVSNVASDVANAASFHVSGSADKTVNGDTEADILRELGLSTSSDAQVKDKDGKVIKTGNANTDPGYDIKAAFKKDLTNYTVSEGTVGKEKIEKAALVVDTTGNTRTYGDVSNVASDVANAASFHVSGSTDKTVNGDTEADILKELGLSTSSAAQVKDEKGKVIKTGNANTDPGYDIKAAFKKDLTNYTVSEGTVGKEKIEKAALVVDTTGNTRTYGDVSNVASDVANAASFHISGSTNTTANGDTEADILKELGLSTSSDAQVTDDAGNVVKTGDANTDPGYDIKAKFNTDLKNYTVSEGTVGKEKIEKAALVVDTKGDTRTYGDVTGVASDVANAASFHVSGSTDTTVNGDTEADILKELGLSTSSDAQVKDAAGNVVKTGDANTNPGYDIKAKFNTDLTNYTVSEGTVGKEKIEKAALVVDTTGNTRTYGDVPNVASDVANAASFHVSGNTDTTVNGDTEADILKELGLSTSSDAQVKDAAGNVVKTGDANTNPGYDIKAKFNTDLKNYTVSEGTVGKEKIEKAALVVDTKGNTRTYGDVTGVAGDVANAASFHVSGSTDTTVNGDSYDDILKKMNLSTDSKAQVKDDAGNVVKTGNANTEPGYDIDASFEKDLTNYTVTKGVVGKEKIEKATLNLANGSYTVTYGDVDTVNDKLAHATTITGFQNGDTTESLKDELKLVNTSKGEAGALLDDVRTNDVDTYNIHTDFNPDMTNYNVVLTTPGTITLTPKPITVKNTMTQQYGSSEKTFAEATVSADQLANGDTISTKDLKFDIVSGGKYEQSLKENQAEHADAVSADAGTYTGELVHTGGGITHADGTDAYKNYIVTVEGDIVVTPADLTVKINDASTQYGTPFDEESGKKSYDYTVVSGNANGDTTAEVKDLLGQLKDYKNAGVGDNGRATQDVGSYGITGEQANTLKNYTVKIEDGMATITKAPLTITTGDVKIDYGTDYATTVGKTVSRVTGLTNGDKDTDVSYNYGNYGGGYIEDNTKTNNVGDYSFTTNVSNKSGDFPKNYTISGGDATLTITPKDVYFHVDGNGNTLADIVYTTTDPNHPSSSNPINGQLVYGETVTPSYRPDGRLPNGHYGVSTSIDGKTISDKDVYGNYRYHYDGDITVSMPNKPDILPPVNPPVTPGTGTVTPLPEQPTNPSSNTPENTTETTGHKTVWDGDRGGDRPEDKRVVTLPFFKVLEDKTTHRYGTYDVAKRTTEVKIEPSAQVLPEPNQPATQYRELTTELTTDKGMGEFTLKYNGSRFTILPDDDAAMKLIVVGDETKNRALFEKALHVAFTQMGLEVADLDGVYIHFGKD